GAFWNLGLLLPAAPMVIFGSGNVPLWGFVIMFVGNAVYWLPAAWYIPRWVDSITYEMTSEEVIVHKGVLGRVHKIVPFRTVTNVSIMRRWFDRLYFGIGMVNIQTAGAGASSIAEERLVGLTEYEKIRDEIVSQLRRYRADTGPALGGGTSGARPIDAATEPANQEIAQAMLEELKAIRELLEKPK
ncbi:MAG TPA: PH domain-containing protein, partial [Armatimonadota bacterium]|nr:PH domain-containing protein [Armatimonadota bacterium]